MKRVSANPGVRCPHCHSTKVWKRGFMPSKSGPKRRYQCTECGTSWMAKEPKSKSKKKGA